MKYEIYVGLMLLAPILALRATRGHDTVSGLAGKEVSEKRSRCHRSLKMECPIKLL